MRAFRAVLAVVGGCALMMLGQWVTYAGVVAAVGFIGLFPAGRAERPRERRVLGVAVALAALLPVLNGLSSPEFRRIPSPIRVRRRSAARSSWCSSLH
jgi:hypothetical protein